MNTVITLYSDGRTSSYHTLPPATHYYENCDGENFLFFFSAFFDDLRSFTFFFRGGALGKFPEKYFH